MRRVLKDTYPYRFTIKYPTSGRTRFRVEKRKIDAATGKVLSSTTLKRHTTLEAINDAFKRKTLTREAAEAAVKELVEKLYEEDGAFTAAVFNEDNRKLLNEYWEREYATRDLVDPDTARYELERAVEAVGPLSLFSASREELQRAVDLAATKDRKLKPNKQRRLVMKLQILLRYIGRRDITLRRARPEKRKPRFLPEDDFLDILPHLPTEPIRVLHQVAFYTGARIGECFAMEPHHFDEERLELRIETQIDKDEAERPTKNRRERTTLVFPAGKEALLAWFDMKSQIDTDTRTHMASITRAACLAAKKKPLVFHDLRHCYAIMCRGKGLSTEDVADLIGDSIIVAKEHYTGFGPTSAIMDLRRAALLAEPKKKAS
jgi:integrase